MINIAIDGPSGAGKSSLAKKVAKELGFIYADTGALYRAIGLFAKRNGVALNDRNALLKVLGSACVTIRHKDGEQRVFLLDEDVSGLIRTPEMSMYASFVSSVPEVRAKLLSIQKTLAAENNVVMDGRDIGTVILPDADVKIFLTAAPEVRAMRRFKELTAKGMSVTFDEVLSDMTERDKNDSGREISPAVAAADAIILDNSELDEEQTVSAALDIINKTLDA
ncbi:MAG: (d)CMP kinase [Firmicutes bacterium]|nr:(d)CMP kinase [Bacillota bacterium]